VIDATRCWCKFGGSVILIVSNSAPAFHILALACPVMSDDEFDNIPDDFSNVQDIDWAHLLAGPSRSAQPRGVETEKQSGEETHSTTLPSNSLDNDSSSFYFSDDDGMDASFLAELDRVEQSVNEAPHLPAPSPLQISGKVVCSPPI